MKILLFHFLYFMYILNSLTIIITATNTNAITSTKSDLLKYKRNKRFIQQYRTMSQSMFMGDLKKLNVRLLEEESIGREVANLQFLINHSMPTTSGSNNNNNNNLNQPTDNSNTHSGDDNDKLKKSNNYYYQIFNSEPQSKYFHLDAQTGVLRVARRIDRDQLCPTFKSCCAYSSYSDYRTDYMHKPSQMNLAHNSVDNEKVSTCQLDLNIRSDDQYTNIITVNVQIIDINDNAPTWLLGSKSGFLNLADDSQKQDVMHVYVSESSLIGDTIQLTPAVDQDAGSNNIIKYLIEPQVPEFELEWTSLDRDTSITNLQVSDDLQSNVISSFSETLNRSPPGPRHELRLIVRSPLDRETESLYEFNLTAVDGGSPSRNATILLQVHVTDFNDNSPIFEKDTYIVDLRENARPHTPVVQVKATDIDEGSNAQIKYRISSLTKPEFMRLFALDPITGWIHVQWEVDYEIHKKIILTVEASDGGTLPRSTTCIVEITVLDENDHSPELHFEPAHLTNYALVPENEKPGRLVAVFTAQDKDSGDNGRVSCRLTESRKWHFDTQNKEKLENLLLNPTETLFSLQQMHMPFSFMYKLTTASSFDREFISKITVWITCSDYGTPVRSSTGSVIVRITDVNDEVPVFSQMHYYFNVNENSEIGTVINRVNATDPDEGDNAKLTYWLSGQNADFIEVNKITGHLSTQKALDREMLHELRFHVHAADSGLPSLNATADVTITIQDVNDNPPSILDKIEFYVLENHTASLSIGKITAHDLDIGRNAEISYALIQCIAYKSTNLNTSEMADFQSATVSFDDYFKNSRKNISQSLEIMYTFFIAKDGQIYLGRSKLDRELYPLYELTVRVEDQGSPKLSSTTIVLIHVLDVNDNTPRFIFPSVGNNTVYVPRETKPGTNIARVYAVDEDSAENGRITYGIKANEHTNHQSLFELDPVTGDLILKRSLDFNMDSSVMKEGERSSKRLKMSHLQSRNNNNQETDYRIAQNHSSHDKIEISESKKRIYDSQMAYSLIVTVTDNGEPQLKSSTILRILFTPPFYPPNNHKESSNSVQTKNTIWNKSSKNNLDFTRGHSASNDFDYNYRDPPAENELTGIGVLLGLVTAIGLFVCFLILVIMITFHQSRKLSEHRKQLLERRRQVNSQNELQHQQSQQQQQQHQRQQHLQAIPINIPSTHFLPNSIIQHIPNEQFNKSEKNLTDISRHYCIQQTMSETLPPAQIPLVTSFTTL